MRRLDHRIFPLQLRILAAAVVALAVLPRLAQAQAEPSGFEDRHSLWVGGECSYVSASFPYQSGQHIYGCGVFTNMRWTPHFDLEGNARWLPYGGFAGTTESSYVAGPRYIFRRFGKIQPYGKFLVGAGVIHYPYNIGDNTYFALAPGGGVNYRASRRLTFRAEYEYQVWINSPGFANEPGHTLKPNGFHVGLAYRLLYF
jgi:opacity protein-like surface antigen